MFARGVLVAISGAACGVIYAVHYQQEYDKAEMHKGVLRDLERRKSKAASRAATERENIPETKESEHDMAFFWCKQRELRI